MPKISIVKRYRSWHHKAGIEEADYVELEDSNACAEFVTAVNANDKCEFEIIDYSVALIAKMETPEILKNPTGGGVGKLILPNE